MLLRIKDLISPLFTVCNFLVLFLILVYCLLGISLWDNFVKETDGPFYDRVQYWINSSKCYLKNKKLLTYCNEDGSYKGIEEGSLADDRGYALFGNIYSIVFNQPITKNSYQFFNVVFYFSMILILNIYFFSTKNYFASSFFLFFLYTLHERMGFFRVGPDVNNSYEAIGIASSLIIILINKTESKSKIYLGTIIVMFLATMRESIMTVAIMGMGLSFSLQSILFERNKKKWFKKIFFIGVLFVLSINSNSVLMGIRDIVWSFPDTGRVKGHGIAHTLIAGLGTEGNPWGFVWNDQAVEKLIKNQNKEIEYVTNDYFRACWRFYFKFASEHPTELFLFYLNKIVQTIKSVFLKFLPIDLLITILIVNLAFIVNFFRKKLLLSKELLSWLSIAIFQILLPVLSLPTDYQYFSCFLYSAMIITGLQVDILITLFKKNITT